MVHRHIHNVLCRAEHKSQQVRIGILIPQDLIRHKAPHGKIAAHIQIMRLVQHLLEHFLVDPASEIPERRVLLVFVACIGNISSVLDSRKKLSHLVGRCLSVIIEADHNVPLRRADSCHQCRVLAEIPGKIHPGPALSPLAEGADDVPGFLSRAVVHHDDFIRIGGQSRHGLLNFLYNPRKGLFRVVTRNHKADRLIFLHNRNLLS